MSLRPTLERERQRYRLPPDAFERLVDVRDRRRRRERTVTLVVAFLLAGAAVAGAVSMFRAVATNRPAEHGSVAITPSNVGRLRVAWQARLPHRAGTMTIADGTVFAVTDVGGLPRGASATSRVLAFPIDCARNGGTCSPSWTADIGAGGVMPDGPAVADGMVFVGGSDLFAYRVDCRTDGGACRPSWTGSVDGVATQPVVDGSNVYVATTSGGVYAFPLSCDDDPSATCGPAWSSAPVGIPLLASAVGDGRVFVSVVADERRPELNRLFAFDTSCSRTCSPAQVSDVPGATFASTPALADGILYVGTAVDGSDGSLVAFDASCGIEPACELWSVHRNEALNIPRPLVADGLVVTAARYGTNAIRAFRAGRQPSGPVWSSCCTFEIADNTPVAADGLVYVSSHLEGVSAYRLRCAPDRYGLCRPAWTWRPTGSADARTAAVGSGTVAVATGDARLVAFTPAPRGGTGLSPAERRATAGFYLVLTAALASIVVVRRARRRRTS
jgi:outer membrane protein assembly factor BamB